MKYAAALLRALAMEPKVLLMDEFFVGCGFRVYLQDELMRILAVTGFHRGDGDPWLTKLYFVALDDADQRSAALELQFSDKYHFATTNIHKPTIPDKSTAIYSDFSLI